jgi:large subunit ribosomal protein L19
MDIKSQIIREGLRENLPDFGTGDTVRVYVKIVEGDKERLQAFEGHVLQKRGSGISSSFTVRKVSNGVGVERIFPLHSPAIDRIEVVKRGKVRKAKLFYLRQRKGRSARVEEKE